MNHAMIDLETLSTRSDSKVLSLGVAIFNDTEVVATDGWAIDLADDVGGHVDWGTVKWWMQQDAVAREFSWTGKLSNATAAFNFKALVAQWDAKEFWSKDPHFDHVILENWWRRVDEHAGYAPRPGRPAQLHPGQFPINYRSPRSFRTLVGEATDLGFDANAVSTGSYVAHNPIDDAAIQARVVIAARTFLRGIPR